jgi:RNA polymerase primary sigma factor
MNNKSSEEEKILGQLGNKSISKFFFKSLKQELLTPEEERDLFLKIKPCQKLMHETFRSKKIHECSICKPIRERLIVLNLRFVVKIAKDYVYKGLPFLDLIQEGNMGVMIAINKFKVEKGFKFSTYATWWIRHSIIRALGEKTGIIRLPMNKVELIKKVLYDFKVNRLEQEGLYSFLERKKYKNTFSLISDIQIHMNEMLSLDIEADNDDNGNKKDNFYFFVASDIESAEYQVLRNNIRNQLNEIIRNLSTKIDTDIISRRYGMLKFYGDKKQTLEKVGEIHGLTKERIRQKENEILKKMKRVIEYNEKYSDILLYRLGIYEKSTL